MGTSRHCLGGFQVTVLNGVMHVNTPHGSVLRVSGLPRSWKHNHEDRGGSVDLYSVGPVFESGS